MNRFIEFLGFLCQKLIKYFKDVLKLFYKIKQHQLIYFNDCIFFKAICLLSKFYMISC